VAAPVAEERWDVETVTAEDVAPQKPLSLAEKAAAKAQAVEVAVEPQSEEPPVSEATAPPWTDEETAQAEAILEAELVPAPLELSKEELRDFMREIHVLPAVAMTTARELFPDWNGRAELSNRQRGQIWERLNP
jgi:hypothetical protein